MKENKTRNLNISEALKDEIELEVKKYIRNFFENYSDSFSKLNEKETILFFCVEMLDNPIVEEYNEECENVIKNILDYYRNKIYKGEYEDFLVMGMCDKIGLILYSIFVLKKKRSNLDQYYLFIENYFVKYSLVHIQMYKEIESTTTGYDSLYGIAGVLNYFLNLNISGRKEYINEFVRYLISYTEYKMYKEKKILNFFIKDSKIKINEYYLDFGMAHGMVGPLIALCKAKVKGVIEDRLDDAIECIFNEYIKYEKRSNNNIIKYPTKYYISDYQQKIPRGYSHNAGWCYGNLGIVRGLMYSAKLLNNKERLKYYQEELLKILNQSIIMYNLKEPILCHGYAGVIAIQMAAYEDSLLENDFLFDILRTFERNLSTLLKSHKEYMQSEDSNYSKNLELFNGSGGTILTFLDVLQGNMNYRNLLLI